MIIQNFNILKKNHILYLLGIIDVNKKKNNIKLIIIYNNKLIKPFNIIIKIIDIILSIMRIKMI